MVRRGSTVRVRQRALQRPAKRGLLYSGRPALPALALDRDRLDVVLGEVGLDELGEREPPCDPPFSPKPLELALERLTSVLLRCEPTPLDALRSTTARAEAIRPQRLAAASATRSFD